MTLGALASLLGGDLHGDPDLPIRGLGEPWSAQPGELTVAFGAEAVAAAESSAAAAVVVPKGVSSRLPLIAVDQPRVALIQLLHAFEPPLPPPAGVHPTAVIDPTVVLGSDVTIGPHAVLEADCVVGDRARIGAGCVLGAGCRLGDDVVLFPRVVLYRGVQLGHRVIIHSGAILGADGFGYRPENGRHVRIPQIGTVILEDDVEVGANTTIDRATVGATRIGRGTKMDNLVVVAHNCRIGEDVIIIAQVGLAGSVTVGDGAMIAGQAGVADHRSVGAGAQLGSQCGVMDDIPAGGRWFGSPAMPEKTFFRMIAGSLRLRDVFARLRRLERDVARLTGQNSDDASDPE